MLGWLDPHARMAIAALTNPLQTFRDTANALLLPCGVGALVGIRRQWKKTGVGLPFNPPFRQSLRSTPPHSNLGTG